MTQNRLTPGARALLASGLTSTKIGEVAHVSRQAVEKWLAGKGVPNEEAQLLLEAAGLATREQWRVPKPPVPAAAVRSGAERDPVRRLHEALAEYDVMLADDDLSTAGRIAAMKARDACAERLAKLRGEMLTESRILKAPAFRRLLAAMQSALKEWPDAVRAVAIVLRKIADEEHGE